MGKERAISSTTGSKKSSGKHRRQAKAAPAVRSTASRVVGRWPKASRKAVRHSSLEGKSNRPKRGVVSTYMNRCDSATCPGSGPGCGGAT